MMGAAMLKCHQFVRSLCSGHCHRLSGVIYYVNPSQAQPYVNIVKDKRYGTRPFNPSRVPLAATTNKDAAAFT